MDIRQTKITTCVAERETLMIESQQVQNGRVEVMHVDRIFLHNAWYGLPVIFRRIA